MGTFQPESQKMEITDTSVLLVFSFTLPVPVSTSALLTSSVAFISKLSGEKGRGQTLCSCTTVLYSSGKFFVLLFT